MATEQICSLPVGELDDENSVLFLWCTWPLLSDGFKVISAWGFDYITGMPWVKIVGRPKESLFGGLEIKPQYGTGFWIRGCSEPLMIARKGKPEPCTRDFCGIISPNFQHSRKPENLYEMAENCSPPYLELFARREKRGWDCFGNEVDNSIVLGGAAF